MDDNINTNTMVGKVVAVCIALLFIVVLAFPIANSLSNMGGNGGGNGAVGSATPITYTNEGQYYYADYDKAVADAMPVTVSVVKDETTYADITVGDYSFRTPAHKSNLSDGDTEMNDAVFTIPILQVSGHYVDSDNPEYNYDVSYVYAFVGQYNVLGEYVIGHMEVTYLLYGGGAEEISTYTWNDDDSLWFDTIGELLVEDDESYMYGAEYTTVRVISQEGEYVYAKNPIVSDISDVLSFNLYYKTYSTYSANTYNYYTTVVGAKGTFSYNEYAQLGKYSMTNSNQLVPTRYNNPTITLNTSNLDGNTRLDGFSILYVGDSSNGFAYVGTCDAYAIVPKTVEYSLLSGSNVNNVQAFMTYYETAPELDIEVSYTTETREVTMNGTQGTVKSIDTVTLTYNGQSVTIDNTANIDTYYERMATISTEEEIQELNTWKQATFVTPVLINPDSAVNMSAGTEYAGYLQIPMLSLPESRFDTQVARQVPTDISISSTDATIFYANNSTSVDISGGCYIISNEGEYGFFTPAQLEKGVYVSSDILDFDGAIMGEDYQMGFSWISGMNTASSLYEANPKLVSNYHLDIEDGKLTDIGWHGGYGQTGSTPRGEFGEISSMFVVLPTNADNGGSGGDDSGTGSNIGGVAGTLIKLVPILMIVGLLMMFIVPMVYKPN